MSVTPPFELLVPVAPEDVVGRDDTLALMRDRVAHGRSLLLAAPRRYGKTSLLRRLAAEGAATGDLYVVHVDLLGVQTIGDVTSRLAAALRDLPDKGALHNALARLLRHAPELAVTLGWGAASATVRRPPAPHTTADLDTLLGIPKRAAEHLQATVAVVFDEFQDLRDIRGADAAIRTAAQTSGPRVAFIYAGSEPSLMEMLFTDRSRPLYNQAERIPLGPLEPGPLGELIDAKFAETGRTIDAVTLAELLLRVQGHPQRAMLLAHHLWLRTPEGREAGPDELDLAFADALESVQTEAVLLLRSLTAAQAKVVRLVAHGEPLYGASAARLDLAKSTATKALDYLRSKAIVTGDPVRVVDPLMADWFRRELPLA